MNANPMEPTVDAWGMPARMQVAAPSAPAVPAGTSGPLAPQVIYVPIPMAPQQPPAVPAVPGVSAVPASVGPMDILLYLTVALVMSTIVMAFYVGSVHAQVQTLKELAYSNHRAVARVVTGGAVPQLLPPRRNLEL